MNGIRRTIIVMALLTVGATSVICAQQPTPASTATYVGVTNCKMCHSDVFTSWSKKPHAHAFDLLVAMKQDKNEKCLPCHTTGYGAGGFTDATRTPALEGVTCEACHGPGSDHNGDPNKITKTPSSAVCAKCHLKADIH